MPPLLIKIKIESVDGRIIQPRWYTNPIVEVLSVSTSAPQLVLASFRIMLILEFSFLPSFSRWYLKDKVLSRDTPRYFGLVAGSTGSIYIRSATKFVTKAVKTSYLYVNSNKSYE